MSTRILPPFPSPRDKIRQIHTLRARSENLAGGGLSRHATAGRIASARRRSTTRGPARSARRLLNFAVKPLDSGFIFRYRAFPRLAFNLWPGLLCLSLLFGLAAPAAAQQQALDLSAGDALTLSFAPAPASAAVLVSNTGQSDNTTGSLGHDHAQAFTTGDNAGGYTLTGVEIEFASAAASTATSFSVGIWSSRGTGINITPDALLGALTCPDLTANANSFLYNCTTSGIDLESSTTYWYVLDSQSDGGSLGEVLQNTSSDAEDAGAASGWSIADDSLFRTWNSTGAWNGFSDSKKIRINGTAKTSTTPAVTISADAATVQEGTAASFTVNASPAPGANLDVNLAVSQSGAFVASGDRGTKTVRINANATSATYSVPTINDNVDEPNGSVTVAVSQGNNYTVGSSSSASVTVTDNDAAPTNVRLSVNDSSVAEDDGATTITVTATVQGQTRFGTAKTVAVSVAGSGGANVVDFTASPSSFDITIAAGAQTGTASFTLTPTNDNVDENNETITVSGSVSGASTQGAAITLADDDAAPTNVRLSVNDSSVAEDDGATTITVTATVQGQTRFGTAKTVAVSVAGSGGANVVDFTASPSSFDITIAAGAQTGTASFTLTPTNDNVDENNETITVSGSVSGASTQSSAITLTDDDDPPPATPVASFASASATAAENAGTQNVTVNLSPAPSANITVNYSLSGTATLGADYAISGVTSSNGSISVSGGNTSVNIPVAITDDSADEPNETVILTLTNGSGYNVGGANAHTLTITDNDDPPPPATPVATFASASATAAESAGTQNVTVNLNPAPSANITVNYSLSGAATLGTDYTISGVTSSNGSISVSGGNTSVNIPVAIADDSADEPNETVILTLTSGSGYDVGGANAHTLTITDNDDAGGGAGGGGGGGGGTGGGGGNDPSEVTLSVAPNPVVEGEEITVTVSLSQLASSAVTIPLVLNAGTAEAGDYGALASIVVDANQPNGTGMIATTKDDDKDDETFTIALGTLPSGFAAGAQASVEITITDATVTSIESPAEEIPTAFALEQNYPNPFNPTTTIEFALDKTQRVTLAVYDLLGQEVQVLVDGVRPAARYRIPFDATDLASGTYLYVLRTEEQVAVKTMALLK